MQSRREFIQAGLAASVVPVALRVGEAATVASGTGAAPAFHRLYCVVCDMRSPHSTAVAREAERLGVTVVRTNGDITDFWFNDLAPIWTSSPAAIGGVTAHGPLFCLERLGWDHGLRVVFRGAHRLQDGAVEHVLSGPFRTIAAAHGALTDGEWPTTIAHLLNSCAQTHDTASTTVRAPIGHEPGGESDDTLFSWVIAPKAGGHPTMRRS